ncbi:MAG: signal peptidase I [Alphaproteobacteria bacterium]|nr:signal peptidase I [Alphaproteobacteria bacterium]
MSSKPPPPPPVIPARPPRSIGKVVAICLAVVISPVIVLFIVLSLFVSANGWKGFTQQSGSMEPSLVRGDWLLVDTTIYARGQAARRGDIIVFHKPSEGSPDQWETWLKRIVGLPGDQIKFAKGIPSINGVAAGQTYLRDHAMPGSSARKAVVLLERLPDGASYEILKLRADPRLDDAGPYVVPDGAYFVVGDNRDDSLDSRWASGNRAAGWSVPLSHIIGRVDYIYWSGTERLDRVGRAVK